MGKKENEVGKGEERKGGREKKDRLGLIDGRMNR